MTQLRLRASLIALALTCPFAIAACVTSHGPDSVASLEVQASVASVTLGGDCAPAEPEPGFAPPADAGRCAEGPCPSFCTQSGVRISLTAGDDGVTVPFEVVSLRLYDLETGTMAESLLARNARTFSDETGYSDWDQMIEPGDDLHVSYDTGAPDWNRIGGGDSGRTYGMSFRVEVDVRVDGVLRTIEFSPASREAEIVT